MTTLSLPGKIKSVFQKYPERSPARTNAVPASTPVNKPKSSYQKSLEKHQALVDDGARKLRYGDLPRLVDILNLNRCAEGPGITAFLNKYLPTSVFTEDEYGNRFLTVNQADGSAPRICYTSHCDTVSNDRIAIRHPICYNAEKDILFRKNGECLGADDGTGVWLMLNMIEAKVPGLYAFYLDEESGREGSTWSATRDQGRYEEIDTFISFDRKGTYDIIATQSGDECCSDAFQETLATMLNACDETFRFEGGAIGSFTDSASFMDDWPECTNLSVGYDLQHTAKETQLVNFAVRLKDALCDAGHSFHQVLPVERDPTLVPIGYPSYPGYGNRYNGNYDDPLGDVFPVTNHEVQVLKTGGLVSICDTFPDAVADMMEDLGIDAESVANYIGQVYFGVSDIRSANDDSP